MISNAKRQFNNKCRVQQDNDCKHRSSTTKRWLVANVPLIIDWLLNSPNLNPLENMRNIMKHRIEKRKATNVNEVKIFIDEEWKKIEKTVIVNLINSMKNIDVP